jgi:hypothetical protein
LRIGCRERYASLSGYVFNVATGLYVFIYSWFGVSYVYINKIQQDATVCRYLFTAKLLNMFRVSIAPIIRGT